MKRPHESLASRVLATVLAVVLAVGGPMGPTTLFGSASAQAVDESRDLVERFGSTMVRLGDSVGAERYDIDEVAFDLAFEDADTIVATVNERLVYEPYLGTLRGAAGTLASGAGNALDQALVTARLLSDAGYEARIAVADIDDDLARRVLATMQPNAVEDDVGEAGKAQLEAFLDEVEADAFVDRAVAAERQIGADVDAAVSLLLESVSFSDDADERLLAAAREYAWVEYRLGDEAWSSAHPIFAEVPEAALQLEPDAIFDESIPEARQHRLRVQAFVERKIGSELEIVPIMEAWERPVANLFGVARTFAISPDGLADAGGMSDLEALAEATNFYVPMVDGDLAPGAQFFDLLGNTVPPDAAASPMAGVFATVGEATSEATSALGGLGSSEPAEPAVALTAVYLDLTVVEPGGAETTHRRTLVDRVGAEARQAGEMTLLAEMDDAQTAGALAAAHTFLLDPGRYHARYVAGRALEILSGSASYLDRVLTAIGNDVTPPLPSSEVELGEATLAPLLLWDAMSDPDLPAEVRSFRPAPGVLMLSQRMDGAEQHVDVVANPRIVVDLSGETPRLAPQAAVRAGAWETRTEAIPFEGVDRPSSPSYEALAGAALLPVDSPEDARSRGMPEASVAAIAEDLARGYRVLAPESAAEIGAGWWRIDPVTGETLGRGLDGRGNAFLEYLTSFEVSLAITAGFTVYGVHSCTQIEDSTQAGCCIVQNVALAATGVGVGVAAGLALGVADKLGRALALFGALDIGGNIGASFIPTFCPV